MVQMRMRRFNRSLHKSHEEKINARVLVKTKEELNALKNEAEIPCRKLQGENLL